MRSRIVSFLLILLGGIIAARFFPAAKTTFWQLPAAASLLPIIFGLTLLTTRFRLGRNSTIVLASLVFGFGAFIAVIADGFSHTGSELSRLHVTCLTLAMSSSLVLIVPSRVSSIRILVASLGLAPAAIASLWSLQMGWTTMKQAMETANGDPYCIARHDGYPRQSPISNLADLRGFSFYTTASGYKDNSSWYFHGVMIVAANAGPRYFNWSPRDRRFNLVERQSLLLIPIEGTCDPQANFLENLPIV